MSATPDTRAMAHADFVAEAKRRFGEDVRKWATVCPECGDVATLQDFYDAAGPGRADTAAARFGQECIGRLIAEGLGRPSWVRGCHWTAYGLIPGPWSIELSDGRTIPTFPLASSDLR